MTHDNFAEIDIPNINWIILKKINTLLIVHFYFGNYGFSICTF